MKKVIAMLKKNKIFVILAVVVGGWFFLRNK